MTTVASVIPDLSEEQWQGLARLGEWVNVASRAFEGPLGSVAIDYVEQAVNVAPSNTLLAIKETLTMLVEWSQDGTLRRLNIVVALISSMLSEENINALALALLDKAQETHFSQTVNALAQGLSATAHYDTKGLGGIGGLLRVMTNKDVQAGLRMLSSIAAHLQRLVDTSPSSSSH